MRFFPVSVYYAELAKLQSLWAQSPKLLLLLTTAESLEGFPNTQKYKNSLESLTEFTELSSQLGFFF